MKPSLSQINKPREHLSPQPGTTQRPTWVSALPALRSQASPPSGQLGVLFGALSLFLYHVTKELEISHFVKLPFLPPQSLPCHFPREQRSSMINSPRPSGILAFGCPSHYFWKKKKKTSLYWGTDDLQCCDSFRWTEKGFSHTYTCIRSPPNSPLQSRLPHNIEQSSLCYTVSPCWLSILNTAMCMCPSQTPKLSLFCFFPLPTPHLKFLLKVSRSVTVL